jgi:hypothetical protein
VTWCRTDVDWMIRNHEHLRGKGRRMAERAQIVRNERYSDIRPRIRPKTRESGPDNGWGCDRRDKQCDIHGTRWPEWQVGAK